MKPVPAIVLGSHVTGLAVLRRLARLQIPTFVAAPPRDIIRRSRWYRRIADRWWRETDDAARLSAYLDALALEQAVLIPCSDRWVTAVASLPAATRDRFPSYVPPPSALSRLVRKGDLARTLASLKIPHPETRELRDDMSAEELTAMMAHMGQAFLKPTSSQDFVDRFGRKAFSVSTAAELQSRWVEARGAGIGLLLQEYVPGPPSSHVYVEGFVLPDGTVSGWFARRRFRIHPPLFGNSTVTRSIALDEVVGAHESAAKLVSRTGYRGVFSVEFKQDERDGVFKLLELNARPWWYVGFAASCGIDYIGDTYRAALGLHVEPVDGYQVGRTVTYTLLDVPAWLQERKTSFRSWIPPATTWLFADHAIYDGADPLPAMAEFASLANLAWRRTVALGRR